VESRIDEVIDNNRVRTAGVTLESVINTRSSLNGLSANIPRCV
jgi:hypothetical protein